jgi:hypothetical protein
MYNKYLHCQWHILLVRLGRVFYICSLYVVYYCMCTCHYIINYFESCLLTMCIKVSVWASRLEYWVNTRFKKKRHNIYMYSHWNSTGRILISVEFSVFSTYCILSTRGFQQWGFFYVPHLLQKHCTSVYKVSLEGPAPTSHSGTRTHDAKIISLCIATLTIGTQYCQWKFSPYS